MNILVLNCGSSSLKYRLIEMPGETELVKGEVQRVGIKTKGNSFISHTVKGKERKIEVNLVDYATALKKSIQLINEDSKRDNEIYFDCFAHRYVNAENYFSGTSRIFPEDLQKLQNTFSIAPLHNPIMYQLIENCSKDYFSIPQYIVLDHSFHRTIPDSFSTYALPLELTKKYNLKKTGYHGISHQYVMQEACKYLNKSRETQKIISCHLGTGGSSICAIQYGKSVNSSMGFTPLEGLIMNTRSGDIDAGMILYLMFNNKLSVKDAETILNKKSGILSIYGESSDLRDAIKNRKNNPKARIAFDMYVRKIKKYIGNYMLQLKKADALIFTDSLGIEMPIIRNAVCEGLECFGIKLDENLNNIYNSGIADVSLEQSEVRILIIPTNEELMIAREAYEYMSFCKVS